METKLTITENIELLKWFYSEECEMTDTEKSKIFVILSLAYSEDAHAFLRIFKYLTNKRDGSLQEQRYKVIIHFLTIMIPNILMSNIDDFISLGYKNDVVYYAMSPQFAKHIVKFVNHKARHDEDFKQLLNDGKLIKQKERPKINFSFSDNNFVLLMENILDEPLFNNTLF